MKSPLPVLSIILMTLAAHGQVIERVGFSALAISDDAFQMVAGAPFGQVLSSAGGSLTISAEYGANTFGDGTVVGEGPAAEASLISVYPSPTADFVHVHTGEPMVIRLFDGLGRLLAEHRAQGTHRQIDLRPYAAGQFIIKIGEDRQAAAYRVIRQ